MNLILQRYSDNRKSTLGLLFKKLQSGKDEKLHLMSYTIEDEYREEKVSAETRIPAGFYELALHKADTPLTKKYQSKFPTFFTYHIEVTKVPNFVGVYMHIGNTDIDSAGCILLGDSADNNSIAAGTITNSTQAFTRIYKEITEQLKIGKCFIEIRDENKLL